MSLAAVNTSSEVAVPLQEQARCLRYIRCPNQVPALSPWSMHHPHYFGNGLQTVRAAACFSCPQPDTTRKSELRIAVREENSEAAGESVGNRCSIPEDTDANAMGSVGAQSRIRSSPSAPPSAACSAGIGIGTTRRVDTWPVLDACQVVTADQHNPRGSQRHLESDCSSPELTWVSRS